ncbi:GGDEF domain-containing protein [Paraclostridium bifermentans]|uniref:GGDEF domain-containing protein n=1 Tax=Paraclostridium bifermentans TaxID=1490 RepID=UPI00359C9B8E
MTLAKNTIDILGNIFMIQRVVDPQNKKIIDFENNIKINENHKCFDFWNNGSACSNCISMRALNENSSFSKIEHLNENLYMIIASPININGETYVVELIKDVTNDTMFSMFNNKTIEDLREEIHRLNMIAVTDELTNIFNRRYLDENLPVALRSLSNSDFSLSLIMLDIDSFKLINDTYGHLCGDYVIKEIAHLIDTYVKTFNGWTCRYGGDEFIAVIENISKEKTYEIIDLLKNTIDSTSLIYNNNIIKITCSFGVSYLNKNNLSIDDALNLVDNRLYKAKKNKDSIC